MADFCGTGSGNISLPGDPNLNSSLLSARSARGGIMLTWTIPGVNPGAVSHTRVYRSTSSTFATAAVIANAGGFYYFDASVEETVGTQYFYWIQLVSVNNTLGDVIGPASAVMQPPLEDIINILTGAITSSALATSLKEEIAQITTVASALDTETQERLFGETVFSDLLQGLQAELADVDTLVRNEITTRTNADSALVAQVNTMLAKANDNAAAIQEESAVRADADSAIALQVSTLQATSQGQTASLQTLQQVVTGPEGLTAQYMVKTDVNGYVSGYGLYNDGTDSQFIIRADTFAVGLAGQSDAYPFIIGQINGETKIVLNAQTLIPDASITNAQIGNLISSDNYVPGVRGWGIFKNLFGDSYAEFNNIKARGDIQASSLTAGIVTAENIKGGAVTAMDSKRVSGLTVNANSEVYAYAFTPNIAAGLTGDILFNIFFAGQAQYASTNCGVNVYRINPGNPGYLEHSEAISVLNNFTQNGATSYVSRNVLPGTVYHVYLTNTWFEGQLIAGRTTGSFLLTLL